MGFGKQDLDHENIGFYISLLVAGCYIPQKRSISTEIWTKRKAQVLSIPIVKCKFILQFTVHSGWHKM